MIEMSMTIGTTFNNINYECDCDCDRFEIFVIDIIGTIASQVFVKK
jgi:hypothetical protein